MPNVLISGSLEDIVENLVKTWEVEATHKLHLNQWTTIDVDNYTIQVNNGPIMEGKKAFQMAKYNALMRE